MNEAQEVSQADAGQSQIHSPHGPLGRIACARQNDGTFRIQHLEAELVPHMQPGPVKQRDRVKYSLAAQQSAAVDVVFVPTRDFYTLPIFAEQAEREKKCDKMLFRSAWPQDLVVHSRSGTSSTTRIEWRRPYRGSACELPTLYESFYQSQWLYLNGCITSEIQSVASFGVLLQVIVVQTSKRLAIGLLLPRPMTEINGGKRIETHMWDEISQKMVNRSNITPETLHDTVLEALYHVILADEHQILSQIESGLCDVDSYMDDDEEVQYRMGH